MEISNYLKLILLGFFVFLIPQISTAAPLSVKEAPYKQTWFYTVFKVYHNGQFNRCTASIQQKPSGMLRIALDGNRQYTLSFPNPAFSNTNNPVNFSFDNKSHVLPVYLNPEVKQRAAIFLSPQAVDDLRVAKSSIRVQFGIGNYNWSLNTINTKEIMSVVDSCVRDAKTAQTNAGNFAQLIAANAAKNSRWRPDANGKFPINAFKGGNESDGTPFFVCRASYNGGVHPGKIRSGFGGCNIPYGGQEITVGNYEVLTY